MTYDRFFEVYCDLNDGFYAYDELYTDNNVCYYLDDMFGYWWKDRNDIPWILLSICVNPPPYLDIHSRPRKIESVCMIMLHYDKFKNLYWDFISGHDCLDTTSLPYRDWYRHYHCIIPKWSLNTIWISRTDIGVGLTPSSPTLFAIRSARSTWAMQKNFGNYNQTTRCIIGV